MSPKDRLSARIILLVAKYGEVRATLLTTFLAMTASVCLMALADLAGVRVTWVGYLLSLAFPGLVSPPICYVAYSGFSTVIDLQNELKTEVAKRQEVEDRLRQMVITDSLTGTYNRRHFMEWADKEISRAQRYPRPLAVMILDLDNFKEINDSLGHAAGDEALRQVVAVCAYNVRVQDMLARLGGDEFVIGLPETPLEGAAQLAERLRREVACTVPLAASGAAELTVSIGLAVLGPDDRNVQGLLARADRALLEAKAAGKNRVLVAAA